MKNEIALFLGSFSTLLAVINPLEVLPVYLRLMEGKDPGAQRRVALRSCWYAALLMFFFLICGNLVLRFFGVPLSMVRLAGGIVLMRIGFSLFMPSASDPLTSGGGGGQDGDVAFVPLAMPLMFGPGVLATVVGMSSLVRQPESHLLSFAAIALAILATMAVAYLALAYADIIAARIGPKGIDAATRIVGFFVAAMGMGLIFHGLTDVLSGYGFVPK